MSELLGDAIILTGPTGSGKSALAIELAEHIQAEIVAMDSMTVYRGMDIGTAKPTPTDRSRIPHHLIDLLDPWDSANVAWYLQQVAGCVSDIRARGRLPLFVGGTPFYLKALLFGLFPSPPADHALRSQLEEDARRNGYQALHERLAQVDPLAASRLHPNDVRRVVRALEVFTLTGRPISSLQRQWEPGDSQKPDGFPRILCLDLPRPELYDRIDRRVEMMIQAGWLDEVRQLQRIGRPLGREAAKALGYAELFRVLAGEIPLKSAVATIQLRSRQFAKRQLTWFRHLDGLQFVRPELTLLVQASRIR